MAKFTKGQWIAVGGWVEHPDDRVADICSCYPESMGQEHLGRSIEETMANARLIAAAPDLIAALKHALRWHDQLHASDIAMMESAIAKAEGKA